MKKLIYIYISSFILCVDVASVNLPVNAESLSSFGYGIASKGSYSVNPAFLSTNDKTFFDFSSNDWFFDVSGSYISYTDNNTKLAANYWQVDDIGLYGDSPSSSPESTFGSKTTFISLAQGYKVREHHFGFSLKYSYMNLLEYSDRGLVLDLGYQHKLNKDFSLAVLLKNLNSGFKNSDQIPKSITFGTSYEIRNFLTTLNSDLSHNFKDKTSSFYQGIVFKGIYFDITAGYIYNFEIEEADRVSGINFDLGNIKFSMSILNKESNQSSNPVFYQISYSL